MATKYGAVLRCLSISVAIVWGVGPTSVVAGTLSGPDSSGYTFQVDVPEPSFSVQTDGASRVNIEGFEAMERRLGAPNLPSRVFLVAIPPGATPGLEYSVRGRTRSFDRLPTAVPRKILDSTRLDENALRQADRDPAQRFAVLKEAAFNVHDRDAQWFDRAADESPWVWLGEPGILRSQRYVPVHVRAARWDGESGRVEVPDGFDIRVTFEEPAGSSAASPDPVFEAVYSSRLLNYDQGRGFRIAQGPSAAVAQVDSSEALRAGPGPRYKIYVTDNGPLRLDFALLDAAGFTSHAIDTWRLANRGETVPLRTNDDGDGMLESGEWIQFYGQALDAEPLPVLNTDLPGNSDIYEARDFTDRNVYFLTVEAPGQAAMPVRMSAPQFALTPPVMVDATAHAETDDGFRPLGGADAWYWLPTLFATGSTTTRQETVSLPGLHDPTLPLQVRVNLRGTSASPAVDPDHQTEVSLFNDADQLLGTDTGFFDDRTLFMHDFGWTSSGTPASDPVKIRIEAVDVGGGARNDVILDYIEIDYAKSFMAINDRFEFTWPDGDAEFLIDGFSSGSIEIWELTDVSGAGVRHPTRLTAGQFVSTGPGVFSARFLMQNDTLLPDGTPRRFLAFAASSIPLLPGADFIADTVSDLRDQAQQADLVVIAHEAVLDATNGSALDQLLAHRAGVAGGNLTSKVARLEDVQDEFNFGLEGPLAIREFLRWVMSTQPGEGWASPKPAYVLLLGDGSFDYKGGLAQGNYLPTQIMYKDVVELGYYASDNAMAAVVGGDQLADLIVGRLPARSLVEANGYLQKVLDYETLAPGGAWRQHMLTVADQGKPGNNPGEALQFELTNATGLSVLGSQPYTSLELKYWLQFTAPEVLPPLAFPEDDMRDAIKDAVEGVDMFSGAALMQYSGHGNFVVWSDDAFFDERGPTVVRPYDAASLNNGLKLPFLVVHNCLSGGFHSPVFETMGEGWLRNTNGGAIAVFAPSGVSFNYIGLAATTSMFESMFGPEKRRDLGAPVMSTLTNLCAQGSIEPCQAYTLLGDPATQLQIHSVEPATALTATPMNLRVDLDWTATAEPMATYRILRTEVLDPPFYIERAAAEAGTTFTDNNVIDGRTYYYAVIATDADGFESAWSNLNATCLSLGPDCVYATPTNPNPPTVPTGLAPFDPGVGDLLRLDWNPNPEADIDFYTIKWGAGAGNPANQTQTSGPPFTLQGLTEGVTYCATVSATNTSGKTSAETTEVCDFPALAPGLRLPDFIDDLRVSIAGADVVLDWTEVTEDVYGKPATVVNYEIYRGGAPDYTNGGLVKIADCPAPCASWPDTGAATSGQDAHYRVRAIDGAGLEGALGSEAPQGVFLDVVRGTLPGDLMLTWPQATTTLDGLPLDLGHYAIYASDVPISKTAVVGGALSPTMTVTTNFVEISPPAQSRFYSVFVVDARGNISPD